MLPLVGVVSVHVRNTEGPSAQAPVFFEISLLDSVWTLIHTALQLWGS